MSPLPIILFSLALHILGFWLLIRHARAVRRRASMPVIGSDPLLTEVMHARICRRQPLSDWLNKHVMHRKVSHWLRTGGREHE